MTDKASISLKGDGFRLYIESQDGAVMPIIPEEAPQKKLTIPYGDINVTGTLKFASWVDRWKLDAWLAPPR